MNQNRYSNAYDVNFEESQEWLDSYKYILDKFGFERASWILMKLRESLYVCNYAYEDYILHNNTILSDSAPVDIKSQEKLNIRNAIKWNAVAMVVKAQWQYPELGGHLSTCLSIADLYDIAYEYFFNVNDLVYFQGHSSPIIYARSFIEGRLSSEHLDNFRRELGGKGLSSYPHPYLMPDYWQYPTVSMGLGLLQAVHQARIMRYLENRNLIEKTNRKVWAFVGDGEMRECESMGCLYTASKDNLDNLIVVVNANLQGLDGLCHGNGSIIRDLEKMFHGFSWRVIKIVWNSAWLELFKLDKSGEFYQWMHTWVDGDHQSFYCKGVQFLENKLAKEMNHLLAWFQGLQFDFYALKPAGHDVEIIYKAYAAAIETKSRPCVILVQSIKGYGLDIASHNIAHQYKKMTNEQLQSYGKHLNIPLSDDELFNGKYFAIQDKFSWPCLPSRVASSKKISKLSDEMWLELTKNHGLFSTTSSFVRVLSFLLRNEDTSPYIVPIVADEARTFGMEGIFKKFGIYSARNIIYESYDIASLTGYVESTKGVLLQEGINEAGSLASWLALATSYSNYDLPILPFYIFYSMFGFQRVMDIIWAASDSMARGFLLGATSGRTTLAGEGLQHTDGHSLLLAAVVPNLEAFDPAWHFEVVVLMRYGIEEMTNKLRNLIIYMTLVNEAIDQKVHEITPRIENGIISGMYLYKANIVSDDFTIHILASGAIFHEALSAFESLSQTGLNLKIYSVTSFGKLRSEAEQAVTSKKTPYITSFFDKYDLVVSVTDYVKILPDLVRAFIPCQYEVLGTDGFGPSDTRQNLRKFFGVASTSIIQFIKNAVDVKRGN